MATARLDGRTVEARRLKAAAAAAANGGTADANQDGTRRCKTCNAVKTLPEFPYLKRTGVWKLQCKACRNKAIRDERLAKKGLPVQPDQVCF